MKCPKCGVEMILKQEDKSFNPDVEPKKWYGRTVYWCEKDDVWVKVETPLGNK